MKLDDLSVSLSQPIKMVSEFEKFLIEPGNRMAVDVLMAIRDGYKSRDEIAVELELAPAEISYAFSLIGPTMIERDRKAVSPMLKGPRLKLSDLCERAVVNFLTERPHERRFRKYCTKEDVRIFCEKHLESIALYSDLICSDHTLDMLSLSIPLGMNSQRREKIKTWFGIISAVSRFDRFQYQLEKIKQIGLVNEDYDGKLGINPVMRPMIPLTWQRLQPASRDRLAKFRRRIEALLIP